MGINLGQLLTGQCKQVYNEVYRKIYRWYLQISAFFIRSSEVNTDKTLVFGFV